MSHDNNNDILSGNDSDLAIKIMIHQSVIIQLQTFLNALEDVMDGTITIKELYEAVEEKHDNTVIECDKLIRR